MEAAASSPQPAPAPKKHPMKSLHGANLQTQQALAWSKPHGFQSDLGSIPKVTWVHTWHGLGRVQLCAQGPCGLGPFQACKGYTQLFALLSWAPTPAS